MSIVNITAAVIDVDGTPIDLRNIGPDVWLLGYRSDPDWQVPVKGYDAAVAAADQLAAEVNKFAAVREQFDSASGELKAYAKGERDKFEQANPAEVSIDSK